MTVPVDWRAVVGDWQAPALPLATMAAASTAYGVGVIRLARRGRHWSRLRSGAFATGVAVIGVALCSGIAHYDDSVFTLHVVQHLLLSMVAPPLLALGAPITLAVQASSRPTQRRILRALHTPAVALLTYPVVTWLLFSVSLIVLYATGLYAASLRHSWLHDLVHIHFVTVGALFFWPVVGIDPSRWRLPHGARLLYVFLALPFHAIVGLTLVTASTPLWSAHSVTDQQTGGGVMMLFGDLITLGVFAVVFVQWAQADERAAARMDLALASEDGALTGQDGPRYEVGAERGEDR
ncbi:MAG: hypothetical protein NVS1B12_12530 [Acidimicrobiales bacterium]